MTAPLAQMIINLVPPSGPAQNVSNILPSSLVTSALGILLGASGVTSFFFLLWGGLSWITAGGDKDGLDRARKKVTGAMIGLAIVFSSYALLYIIRVLFNVNLISIPLNPI